MPMVEMGQGIYTAMAMLLAEELEVGLDQVRLEHAPPDDKLYSNSLLQGQTTGDSASIRAFWIPLRQAGAVARTLLIQAAAKQWGVETNVCRAQHGAVVHVASSRRVVYGDLVNLAGTLPVPPSDGVVLKRPEEFTLIGTPAKRLDTPDKVDGRTEFGIDVRLPGLKVAAIAISPVRGGKPRLVNEAAARAVNGVRQVVTIDEAVAVVADHLWAAKKGLKAAAVEWDDGPNASIDSASIIRELEEASKQPGVVARNEGDAEKAFGGAAQRLDAVYQLPFLAHAAMEPMNCTVHYTKDACEVWVGTQVPTRRPASPAHRPADQRCQDPQPFYWRRLRPATRARRHPGRGEDCTSVSGPVKVCGVARKTSGTTFTVPTITTGFLPGSTQAARPSRGPIALQAPRSSRAGCHLRSRTVSIPMRCKWPPIRSTHSRTFMSTTSASSRPQSSPPSGAINATHNVFVVESFIDELAHAAKKDPLAYEGHSMTDPRAIGVLSLAAEKAEWGSRFRPGGAVASRYSSPSAATSRRSPRWR
jgi:isoquinoline 1-oxidoreductase beta subunit